MATLPLRPTGRVLAALAVALAAGTLWSAARADTTPAPDWQLPPALNKAVPDSVEDLRAIQAQVRKVLDKVMPAVVNIKVGPGQGSGVVVSEDGYVLTAGHVSGQANRNCIITFPDGKEVKGK